MSGSAEVLVILAVIMAVVLAVLTAAWAASRHREKQAGYKPVHRR